MEMLIYEILATADRAVDERWHEVGEVTDETMAKLRELMEAAVNPSVAPYAATASPRRGGWDAPS